MAEKKKYNSILVSGRKDETLTYTKYIKDEESGESVKESLDKKVNVTDKLETQQIKDGAITNEKMAAGSVGNTNLQDGSVSNEKLEDGSITNEKLAENSITKDKLKDNTIGVEKLDPELRQTINAATGLPKDLVETIQNVNDTLRDHQSQLADKQQQITANDEDISLLQTRSNQMEETIKSIAATGGASQATAVTYNNEKSKLTAVNIQSAVDEVVDKVSIKDEEGNVQDTPFRVIENEEFIMAVVDSEDRILYGIYRDTGKPYYPQNEMYHISQSEEFLWVILDAANHPLLGIQQDGTCWAAKAQWLDDIKAIKEALKTFQPKEDGKGLINLDVADSFFYISNDEYIIAVVDTENRILAGIKYDAQPYFPNHEMYSVITNEEWLYAIIDAENKVLGGFRADDGHMVVGGIDVSTFISNAIIDIQDIKERTAHLSTIINDEYLSIETDAEGKVIGYIAPDGSHYLYKVKSETIPTEFEHIEDPEGRTEITTDAEDKILGYRDSEGTRHEYKISAKHLELSSEAANEVNDAFKSAGINMENPSDFSKDSHIELPIPRIAAQVRLYAPKLPTTKHDDIEAEIEYNDKDGNYFRKPVILNAQGNSSMAFPVKNLAIDLSDESKIKFGDFPSQDSFHLKKYYMDIFRGQCVACYWLMEQVYQTRPVGKKYPYELLSNPYNPIMAEGSVDEDFYTSSKCHPDGFPIIITWINSVTQERKEIGIYSWNLKKSKEVYHANKKKAENIVLDGVIGNSTLFNGVIDWSQFEIRNPKPLVDINGNKYDGDNPKELSDSDSLSKKVKDYLIRLSAVKTELKTSNTKETFEKYFIVPSFIDYFLVSQVIYNIDGFKKNWIWCTWDGKHWTPTLYDVDSVFGIYWDGTYIIPESDVKNILGIEACNGLNELYMDEIKERYKQLRDANIFSTENITGLLQIWLDRIGYSKISDEIKLYPETPSYRASYIGDGWKIVGYSAEKDNYDIAKTYNIGEQCSYKNYLFEAVKNIIGVSPFEKIYADNPKYSGCYNSVKRVAVWLENRIKFLDNIYSYNK